MEEKLSTKELEMLYEQRKTEYQKTASLKTRLEIEKEMNINEFTKLYGNLDNNIKKIFNLDLDKSVEEMSLDEIIQVREKFMRASDSVSAKLTAYLRTGKVESISDLITQAPLTEPKEVATETVTVKEETVEQSVEVKAIKFGDDEVEDLSFFKN